ncbi:MAG: hypothetical protein LBG13_01225 [Holosporales bacterium]|nr:hypothetical protein [Holosporales bacterium]
MGNSFGKGIELSDEKRVGLSDEKRDRILKVWGKCFEDEKIYLGTCRDPEEISKEIKSKLEAKNKSVEVWMKNIMNSSNSVNEMVSSTMIFYLKIKTYCRDAIGSAEPSAIEVGIEFYKVLCGILGINLGDVDTKVAEKLMGCTVGGGDDYTECLELDVLREKVKDYFGDKKTFLDIGNVQKAKEAERREAEMREITKAFATIGAANWKLFVDNFKIVPDTK